MERHTFHTWKLGKITAFVAVHLSNHALYAWHQKEFKESVLSDIEPPEHHDETFDSSDMNQDDNFFAISN